MNKILDIVLNYMQLMKPVGMVFAILGLVLMTIACFIGYRFHRVWIAIVGFALGALGGWRLSLLFVDNTVVEMLIAIILGFFVAVLAVSLHKFGVFLMCMFFGFGIASSVISQYMQEALMSAFVISVAIGAAIGILGIFFTKPVVIITSALYGGIKIADYIMMIIELRIFYYLIIGGLIIALIGLLVQIFTTRHYTLDNEGNKISEY